MLRLSITLLATLLAPLTPAAAATDADNPSLPGFRAQVLQVTDGDSLRLRPEGGAQSLALRVAGIDAPEKCQAHGPQARAALQALVAGGSVIVGPGRRDSYGRLLARLGTEAEPDVGRRLVAQGHAWSWRSGQHPGPYAAEQAQARAAALGLWARAVTTGASAPAAPMEPREFRRSHGPCEREPSARAAAPSGPGKPGDSTGPLTIRP